MKRPLQGRKSGMGSRRSRIGGQFVVAAIAAATLPATMVAQQDSTRRDTSRVTLPPIEVTVNRRVSDLVDAPLAIGTLDRDEIRRGRATLGLDESLGQIPGVSVSNRHNPSLDQRISIRGFGARSAFGVRGVKVLLDGIPQTLPDGQGQLNNLDLSTVSSIQIIRGSAGSLYGNASGGVVDIRTETPNPTRITANALTVGGAYETFKWRAAFSAPLGTGTFAVRGSRTTSDGFREHANQDQRQVSVRLEQMPAANTRFLVHAHFVDAPVLDNPGSLTVTEVEEDPAQANGRNVDANAGKAVQQGQAGVTFVRDFNSGASLELTGFGLFRDLDNPLSFSFITINRLALGVRGAVGVPVQIGAFTSRLTAGIDVQRQRDDRVNFTPDQSAITRDQLEHVTELGAFVVAASELADWVTVTVGTRVDRVSFSAEDRLLADGDDTGDRVMSAFSGSAGAVFHPTSTASPYVNVSTSFETPTTTELANRPTGPGGFNPDLEPQRATTFEVGIRGEPNRWVSFSAAAFYTVVRDALVSFEVPSEPSRRFFRNAGSTTNKGLELSTTLRASRQVRLVTSYTLADYEFDEFITDTETFNGNSIPGVPTHSFYASLRFTHESGVWGAVDQTVSSDVWVDDGNSAQSDGYAVTDLRAGWEGTVRRVNLAPFVGVRNAFNERYVSSTVVNATFGRYFEPAPPRNLYVGMELSVAGPRR